MGHSFEKLKLILHKYGFSIIKVFTEEGYCFYVELYAQKTSDVFLLYIPSKFRIKQPEGGNVYSVKLIENLDTTDNTGELVYNDKVTLDPHKQDHMNEHLDNQYKHDIHLKNISSDDQRELRSIHKQLTRLRYCVQNITYRIGIVYRNYLSVIRRDDTIEHYTLRHFPKPTTKKMYVLTDLEQLFKNADQLEHDVSVVQRELYKLLEKNQNLHSKVIDTILENKGDIITISEKMKETRIIYETYTERLQSLLDRLIKVEDFKLDELKILNHNSPYATPNTPNNETLRHTLEEDIREITHLKVEISRYLNLIKDHRENILLSVDDILYDNTVMLDVMLKNFRELKKFID